MDPQATLQFAIDALDNEDYSLAMDRLFDYWHWRAGGGFEPPQGDAKARELENSILVCVENMQAYLARLHADAT